MNTVCVCGKIHLIGLDGGLRLVASYLVPDLEKQGWRQVVNPKRNYYPEHDKTSPSYREQELIDLNEDTDLLVVEIL